MLYQFSDQTLYTHSANHISHADLQPLLHIAEWNIQPGQHWAVVGGREDQRSALLHLLSEQKPADLTSAEVSLHEQQRLIDEEIIKSKTGVADEITHGSQVSNMLTENTASGVIDDITDQRITTLGFAHCLNKYFRQLSSGETRRLILLLALQRDNQLLLLEDPFEGLDAETRPVASSLLSEALSKNPARESKQTPSSVFIASRSEQLLPCTTHIAYIEDKQLKTHALDNSSLEQVLASLSHITQPKLTISVPDLPKDHPFHKHPALSEHTPLVAMSKVTVQYADSETPILSELDWQVMPGQHWRVTGPNGSGKSTLLKLITGDHPQVYRNAIEVCGFKRGSGESVWDIKKYIGYFSSDMLIGFKRKDSIENMIISGFLDSVGLYILPNERQIIIAHQWLKIINLFDSKKPTVSMNLPKLQDD